jgi:DNA repair exonuclease SbcCD nuclease subunit
MRLLLTGDWHIRATVPENRVDDYIAVQAWKLSRIFDLAAEEECKYILQPGDMFDTYSAPHWLTAFMIALLKSYQGIVEVITIPGQHDLQNHKHIGNSAIHTLDAAQVIFMRNGRYCDYYSRNVLEALPIHIYSIGWDISIEHAEEIVLAKSATNILLIHKTISDARAMFDVTLAYPMLAKLSFDLIVAGDNHKRFTLQYGDRHLVNCGSLMRMASDQMDHQPAVYVYDTKDKSLKEILIPIRPAQEVFDLGKIDFAQHKKDADTRISAFVAGLVSREETTVNFKRNMLRALEETPMDNLNTKSREIIMGGLA